MFGFLSELHKLKLINWGEAVSFCSNGKEGECKKFSGRPDYRNLSITILAFPNHKNLIFKEWCKC